MIHRLQSAWQRFRYGPWFDGCCYAAAFGLAIGICFCLHRLDATELPSQEVYPHAWLWGLMAAIGVVLLFGLRVWGGVALLFIGAAVSVCYLPLAAGTLRQLPFAVAVAVVLVGLLLLRCVGRYGMNVFCPDSPHLQRTPDALGRGGMYAAIHARIRKQSAHGGAVLAVYGEWGSGKSHLLNYLEFRLRKPYAKEQYDDPESTENQLYAGSYTVCRIQLWRYKSSEDALSSIASALSRAVVPSARSFAASELPSFLWTLPSVFFGIETEPIRKAVVSLVLHEDSPDTGLAAINAYLTSQQRRAVLLIEDVERAEIEVIEHLLPLMERLKCITSLTVLCALDPQELQHKCKQSRMVAGSLQGYLDKIFDMGFSVPPLPDDLSEEYFLAYAQKHYPDFPKLLHFAKETQLHFRTPRQIERVAARLASLEWMYFREEKREPYEVGYKTEFVFYVEILRCLYYEAYEELNPIEQPAKLLRALAAQKEAEVMQKLPITAKLYAQDATFHSLVMALAQDDRSYSINIDYAVAANYTRRTSLTPGECAEIIFRLGEAPNTPPLAMVKRYFGVDSIEKEARIENQITAAALNYVLDVRGPFAAAERFLRQYLSYIPRNRESTHDRMDSVASHVSRAVSYNALLFLFPHLCKAEPQQVYRDLFDLIAEKVSFDDIAALRWHLEHIRHDSELTPQTYTIIRKIKELCATRGFDREICRLNAYCADRLLEYYAAIAEQSVDLPSFFDAERMYYYEESTENRHLLRAALRRKLATAGTRGKILLLVGWVRSLRIKIMPPTESGLYVGVPLKTARLLSPCLRAALQSEPFCAALRHYLSENEPDLFFYAIRSLERFYAEPHALPFLAEKHYQQGTQKIIETLEALYPTKNDAV